MLIGSKMADSTTTSVVPSPISDAAPPMIPAIPSGPGRVGDEQRLRVELAHDVVEGLEALARGRAANDDPAVVDRGGIEGVDRLAEFEHDVVRGIDDVADRPLAGGQEAHLDPVRRRADLDAAHPAADEPRAEVRVARPRRSGAPSVGRPVSGGSVGGVRRRGAGHRGDLAGEPDDRERVAAVRLDVDVEHGVAVQLDQRAPDRGVRGQDQDPVGVGGQAELVARAEHAVADDAHLLGPLDPPIAGQDRAGERDRDALAGGDVGRATDDVQRLTVTDRDPRQRQPVGARMALDGQQLADDHVLPVLAPADDRP